MQESEYFASISTISVKPIDVADHTMRREGFEEYVKGKFSPSQKDMIASRASQIESLNVASLTDEWIEKWFAANGWEIVAKATRESRPEKLLNNIRPSFYLVKIEDIHHVYMSSMFSFEYMLQSSELLSSYMKLVHNVDLDVKAHYFPKIDDDTSRILEFDDVGKYIEPDDFIIFGQVKNILTNLARAHFVIDPAVRFGVGECFSLNRVHDPLHGKSAVLIGSTYTYWGRTLARYVETVMKQRVSHIFYCAKAGIIERSGFAHNIFIPTEHGVVERFSGEKVTRRVETPASLLDKYYSSFVVPWVHGLHVSVPTVMGETDHQIDHMHFQQLNPQTIDNEISYAAYQVASSNKALGTQATFDSIHFITDVLKPDDPKTDADLHRKDEDVQSMRDRQFDLITSLLTRAVMDFGLEPPQRESLTIAIAMQFKVVSEMMAKLDAGEFEHRGLENFVCLLTWYFAYTGDRDLLRDAVNSIENAERKKKTAVPKHLTFSKDVLNLAQAFYDLRREIAARNGDNSPSSSVIENWEAHEKVAILEKFRKINSKYRPLLGSAFDGAKITNIQKTVARTILATVANFMAILSLNLKNKLDYDRHIARRDQLFAEGLAFGEQIENEWDRVLQVSNHLREHVNCVFNEQDHLTRLHQSSLSKTDQLTSLRPKLVEALSGYQRLNDAMIAERSTVPTFIRYENSFFQIAMKRAGLLGNLEADAHAAISDLIQDENNRQWALVRLDAQFRRFMS